MSKYTDIEWCKGDGYQPATWNPILGCMNLTRGCDNCYSCAMSPRLAAMGQEPYADLVTKTEDGYRWNGNVKRNSVVVWEEPLRTKRPTCWFTLSMSDFFFEKIPDEWRAEALDIISRCERHLFLLLTKRPAMVMAQLERIGLTQLPRNCWLGVSVENRTTTFRIKQLQRIPATKKFISFEPLVLEAVGPVDLVGIDWAITGGESGSKARPCNPDWVREIRDQCQQQGVAYFHKQWGVATNNPLSAECPPGESITAYVKAHDLDPDSKGGAGLDGRLWREFPVEASPAAPEPDPTAVAGPAEAAQAEA